MIADNENNIDGGDIFKKKERNLAILHSSVGSLDKCNYL